MVSVANLNLMLDELGSAYLRGLGTVGSGFGLGSSANPFGFRASLNSFSATAIAAGDLTFLSAMTPSIQRAQQVSDGPSLLAACLSPVLTALQSYLAKAGIDGSVVSLDSALAYYNTGAGGPWQALQSGTMRDLIALWIGGATAVSSTNFYLEVTNDLVAGALGSAAIGAPGACTFTPGVVIDVTKYAGGFPFIASTGITGGGAVTVTGVALDPATGSTASGKTWTATIGAGASTVAIVPGGAQPAPANSLIVSATNVQVAVGVTGGSIVVEAHRPAGRGRLPL